MFSIIDNIYFKIRKKELNKAKSKLRKLKVNSIYLCITKNCWKYNIQYQIIIKNKDRIILKLKGGRETILLEYHKIDKISCREYYSFLNIMLINKIYKGIYITNGIFDENILKENKVSLFHKRVKLEDGIHFLKGQLELKLTVSEIFKKNRLNFYKYLPI